MEYVQLGRRGPSVSRIGFGGWAIGGHGYGSVDDRTSIRAVHAALDSGINIFDTADVYGFGRSERVLGKALSKQEKDVLVVTKFGVRWNEDGTTYRDSSAAVVRSSIEASLRRLGWSRIPIYLIHWWDGQSNIEDTVAELIRCRDEGLIGWIGCSNLPPAILELVAGEKAVSIIQVRRGLAWRSESLVLQESIERHGLGTMSFGVLGRGVLTGRIAEKVEFGEGDTRSCDPAFEGEAFRARLELAGHLARIGENFGRTPAQVAIRWVLDEGLIDCAVVGMKTKAQVDENVGGCEWTLPREDWLALDRDSQSLGAENVVRARHGAT